MNVSELMTQLSRFHPTMTVELYIEDDVGESVEGELTEVQQDGPSNIVLFSKGPN